jgi:hypothetical protein
MKMLADWWTSWSTSPDGLVLEKVNFEPCESDLIFHKSTLLISDSVSVLTWLMLSVSNTKYSTKVMVIMHTLQHLCGKTPTASQRKIYAQKIISLFVCVFLHLEYLYLYRTCGFSYQGLYILFVCFESHKQFFSYLATVTITGDMTANLDLCLSLNGFKQWGFFYVPHLLRHGTSVFKVISERPTILISECCALGKGAITTYFKRFRFDASGPSRARTHHLPDAKREHYH